MAELERVRSELSIDLKLGVCPSGCDTDQASGARLEVLGPRGGRPSWRSVGGGVERNGTRHSAPLPEVRRLVLLGWLPGPQCPPRPHSLGNPIALLRLEASTQLGFPTEGCELLRFHSSRERDGRFFFFFFSPLTG